MMKIHFMGIGGSGISSVARIAKANGYIISGCDLEENRITRHLVKEGIPVSLGHDKSHLKGADILAHTPAVFYQNETHPEYLEAKKKNIAITWEEFMATYLMKGKRVIAVSGTHGKGTTSAMLSFVLEKAGLDPTCEIGANLIDWEKRNDRVGKSDLFVCEADEFRDKFLLYKPHIAVITSVEMDHPEYFKDYEAIIASFVKFANRSKIVVINGEDEGCKKVIKKVNKSVKIIKYKSVSRTLKLKLPGNHIRSDAGAVVAVCKLLKIKDSVVKSALEDFSGLERRFEIKGQKDGMIIIDDYAHHPTAVMMNLQAVKEKFPKSRILVVFQPHMHSRLEKLFNEFARVLKSANKVVVTDVYSKREPGVNKPTGKDLALAIGFPKATYVGGELENVANFVMRNGEKGDIILVLGAGDVYKISDLLMQK